MYRVVGALVVNTALNIALVPVWDARGAAAAASVSGLVAVVVTFRAFAPESHAPRRPAPGGPISTSRDPCCAAPAGGGVTVAAADDRSLRLWAT